MLRIIRDGTREADFNMAADRYLLDCAADNNQVILRTLFLAISYHYTRLHAEGGIAPRPGSDGINRRGWISRITGGGGVPLERPHL